MKCSRPDNLVAIARQFRDNLIQLRSVYAYDLDAAAADIWRMKAAHATELVDFSTDGHSVKRSQQAQAYLNMAGYYQQRSASEGVTTAKIVRDDL